MADSMLDPQLSTLDRGSDATFGCGGAALWNQSYAMRRSPGLSTRGESNPARAIEPLPPT